LGSSGPSLIPKSSYLLVFILRFAGSRPTGRNLIHNRQRCRGVDIDKHRLLYEDEWYPLPQLPSWLFL